MGNALRAMGYVSVAIAILLAIILLGLPQTVQTTTANKFQRAVQTDLYAHRDDSARATRGDFFINQTAFEKSVVADMGGTNQTGTSDPTGVVSGSGGDSNPSDGVKFTYVVKTSNGQEHYYSNPSDVATGSIKAVKAQTVIGGHKYQTNAVITNNSFTANDDITNRGK